MRSREWYQKMSSEQRIARQEHDRLNNARPKQQEAKRASKRRRKEMCANTLHLDSIAMENPMYQYKHHNTFLNLGQAIA